MNSTTLSQIASRQLRRSVFVLAVLAGMMGATARADSAAREPLAVAYPFDAGRETRASAKSAPSSALDARTAFITASAIAAQIQGAKVLMVAATGSMRPMFDQKAYLVVEPASFDNLQIGDVVTYVHPQVKNTVVHRIMEKHGDSFWTKGDYNGRMDSVYVTRENYTMRVCAVIYAREDGRVAFSGAGTEMAVAKL